jgi:hypothetical protein
MSTKIFVGDGIFIGGFEDLEAAKARAVSGSGLRGDGFGY